MAQHREGLGAGFTAAQFNRDMISGGEIGGIVGLSDQGDEALLCLLVARICQEADHCHALRVNEAMDGDHAIACDLGLLGDFVLEDPLHQGLIITLNQLIHKVGA